VGGSLAWTTSTHRAKDQRTGARLSPGDLCPRALGESKAAGYHHQPLDVTAFASDEVVPRVRAVGGSSLPLR
jgi:hypothetical protein